MKGKLNTPHGQYLVPERALIKMKIIYYIVFIIIFGVVVLFVNFHSNRHIDPFLSRLMNGIVYKIIDEKKENEGLMGDLNRSWIIELNDIYSDSNFPWSNWPTASSVMTEQEVAELLVRRHGESLDRRKEIFIVNQSFVPQGFLGTMRQVVIRVCVIDKKEKHLLLIIESD